MCVQKNKKIINPKSDKIVDCQTRFIVGYMLLVYFTEYKLLKLLYQYSPSLLPCGDFFILWSVSPSESFLFLSHVVIPKRSCLSHPQDRHSNDLFVICSCKCTSWDTGESRLEVCLLQTFLACNYLKIYIQRVSKSGFVFATLHHKYMLKIVWKHFQDILLQQAGNLPLSFHYNPGKTETVFLDISSNSPLFLLG